MPLKEKLSANEHTSIIKCLADETRIRILRILKNEELNVQEICEIAGLPQPTISRHLSLLKKTGLLLDRRESNRIFYSYLKQTQRSQSLESYLDALTQTYHEDMTKIREVLEKRSSTKLLMGKKADEWDKILSKLYHPTASAMALAGLAPKDMIIADIGCGTGNLLPVLSRIGGTVYAIDSSEEMLKLARNKAHATKLNNIEFLKAGITDLSKHKLPAFDGITMHYVLHQTASPAKIIKELAGLLKKGGRLVLVDRTKHQDENARNHYGSVWLGFSEEQLEQFIEDSGLEKFSFIELHKNGQGETSFVCTAIKK